MSGILHYVIIIVIFLFVIRLVCRGEETNRVTNNIETPPTTPDSFKNTLTTSAVNPVNPKSNVVSDDTKVSTGSNVKHETTIKHSSKNATNVRHSYCFQSS